MIALPCRADESLQSLPSDDAIQELVYSDYKVPSGFYTADFINASPYYENTISVTPNDKRHFPPATQLCAEDYATALTWSEDSAHHSAYYRDLVSTSENDMYYEFVRKYSLRPRDAILSRVYKCSYFVPAPYGWAQDEGAETIGTLKKKPIDLTTVSNFVQYLWYVKNYNLGGAKVLSIKSQELPESILVRLTHLNVVYAGDRGGIDIIRVKHTDYSVSKSVGRIQANTTIVKKLYGRRR
jgi:hypothetical protein